MVEHFLTTFVVSWMFYGLQLASMFYVFILMSAGHEHLCGQPSPTSLFPNGSLVITGFKSIDLSLSEVLLSIINIHPDASSQSLLALLGGIMSILPLACVQFFLSWSLHYWKSFRNEDKKQ